MSSSWFKVTCILPLYIPFTRALPSSLVLSVPCRSSSLPFSQYSLQNAQTSSLIRPLSTIVQRGRQSRLPGPSRFCETRLESCCWAEDSILLGSDYQMGLGGSRTGRSCTTRTETVARPERSPLRNRRNLDEILLPNSSSECLSGQCQLLRHAHGTHPALSNRTLQIHQSELGA